MKSNRCRSIYTLILKFINTTDKPITTDQPITTNQPITTDKPITTDFIDYLVCNYKYEFV